MVHNQRSMKLVLLVSVIGLSLASVIAQDKKNRRENSSEIETYCKQIDAFIKSRKTRVRILAKIDDGDKWREFKSEKARQRANEGDSLNENALVWGKNSKFLYAGFTFQSPSRDWVHYVNYYFRADGTLAKIDAKLNTFYGYTSVSRRQYYARQGKLLKSSVQYLDLKTRRKTKPGDDFIDKLPPVYKQVKSLPFYHVLGRRA